MKIIWNIESHDIERVKRFFDIHHNNYFVRKRIERNIKGLDSNISKDDFLKTMVSCLLTTQQRSGPESAVTKFINTNPFPLNYKVCVLQKNLRKYAQNVIVNFGGLRRSNKISDEITTNLNLLEQSLWKKIFEIVDDLKTNQSISKERTAADFINDNFKVVGPKQSRNPLQSLGLTKYEIPIDSRITKWLNKFGFPVKLSAGALSDKNYYNFISDGFQKLAKESGILPCVLDAAIFVSFDDNNWNKQNVVW